MIESHNFRATYIGVCTNIMHRYEKDVRPHTQKLEKTSMECYLAKCPSQVFWYMGVILILPSSISEERKYTVVLLFPWGMFLEEVAVQAAKQLLNSWHAFWTPVYFSDSTPT